MVNVYFICVLYIVGGTRDVIIPPQLGYGKQSQDGIPANSTLNFEIQLISLK